MKQFLPWIVVVGVAFLLWRAHKAGWVLTTKAKEKGDLDAAIAAANKAWTEAAKKAAEDKPVATEVQP